MFKSTLILLISTGLIAQSLSSRVVAQEIVEPFLQVEVAPDFKSQNVEKILQHQFQLQFHDETLRDFGYQIERLSGLFCWIDTQVNPEQMVSIHTKFQSLHSTLDEVCEQQKLRWIELGRGIFVTNKTTGAMLSMLLAWQREQMEVKGSGTIIFSGDEKLFWLKPREEDWPLLSRPKDLIQKLASEGGLKITGEEKIPHDLLAPGRNTALSRMEYLQTLLVQYGLTWRLSNKQTLEVVTIDQLGVMSLQYSVDTRKKEAYRQFLMKLTGLEVEEQSRSWVVKGKPEKLAEFHEFHMGQTASNRVITKSPAKLSQRKFTLNVENAKVIDILQFLKNNELNIDWDQRLSDQAGVNLEIRVTLNLKNTSLDDMLEQVLSPAGLTYRVQNEVVKVIPNITRPPTN